MDEVFEAAGSLRGAYAAVEWAQTPLGRVEDWSPCLRQTVGTMLRSRFPITLMWGPEFVLVYNEAYVELIADKHPAALGRRAQDVFAEAWDIIGPMLRDVHGTGRASFVEDALVPLDRHGYLEECYFTFSYSAVCGEVGAGEGILDIASETTARVVERRRQQLVAELAFELGAADSLEEVPRIVAEVAGTGATDLPAVAVRLPDLPTADDGLPPTPEGWLPALDALVEDRADGPTAYVGLPSGRRGDGAPAVLVGRLSDGRAPDASYRSFLRQVGSVVDQAVERLRVVAAEREVARRERALSEALQRSLLTEPPEVEGLDLAVRYVPAADLAYVGGDWYDAFPLPDGTLAVAIGDVAGHDRDAAVAMGQARNLLRGVAHALDAPAGEVLTAFDKAFDRLGVSSVATAVLGRVLQRGGTTVLSWSNAGHPPPVLIRPDGSARLLEASAEPLLGLVPERPRSDHEVELEPGSAVVLYTDGLVERRSVGLEVGLAWLLDQLEGQVSATADELCDRLLGAVPTQAEDDIALLVLRVPG